ncbi:MAG TPA: hypothetical protein VHW01_27930, partial [Polyangiaceae bacterium]|nr:hypothetical protein [Polyangiaceae bacterium]
MKQRSSFVSGLVAPAALLLVLVSSALSACKKSEAANASPVGSGSAARVSAVPVTLLNVSYDPTRELYQDGIGDVLITWENEAILSVNELGKGKFEMVAPSISV